MQYKCMERQSRRLSMEGFHFPVCHVYREYPGRNAVLAEGNKESLYTDFLLPLSGPRRLGSKTDSAEYVKVRQHQKHGYHPLQHEPAFPDDKFKVAAGLSCMLSVDA